MRDTPKIILFDIDGTLVSTGGAGRRAMARGLHAFLGQPGALDFDFAGMTDRAILRQALEGVGRAYDDAAHEAISTCYLEALVEELPRSTQYKTMPGVHAFVDACLGRPAVAVGLGTGNMERAAYLKLGPGALDDKFAFGGFGHEAEARHEMLALGAERGAARLGAPLERCEVVIIGDTVRDVVAARAIGARCLAVCTGGASPDRLEAEGAWRVVADLTEPGLLSALFEG